MSAPEPPPAAAPSAPALPVAPPAAADAATLADGVERPLDPRAITHLRIVALVVMAMVAGPLLLALAIVLFVVAMPLPLAIALVAGWAALTAGLAWHGWAWPALAHRHAGWRLDAQSLAIRRGVWWRHTTVVPRSRIQFTDVTQGPVERAHGLGTLVVHTAGTDTAQVRLGGLDHGTALAVRDLLHPEGGDDGV